MIDITDYPCAKKVFSFFCELSKIPRGSGNREIISNYLVEFAKQRKLLCLRDEYDNIIIKKGGTFGYEAAPTVILQGHTDIVAEKKPDCNKDMVKEGLTLYRDGDFIRAEGTSLGGDDGIAIAYALAILDSEDIPHPPIEALFTSDEEIGLVGATGLDTKNLDGKIMINLDSDLEGIFTVGCAGGIRVDTKIPIKREPFIGTTYKITVGGLLGGHSGADIDKNRANAIKLLGKVLSDISELRLIDFCGGNADNAIPRDAYAGFITNENPKDAFEHSVKEIRRKWESTESGLDIVLTEEKNCKNPFDEESTKRLLSLINSEPTGVVSISKEIAGLVETSLNMGIASTEENSFTLSFSIRSSKNEEKEALKNQVTLIAERHDAYISERGDYPAWEYRKVSPLKNLMCEIYESMYQKSPEVLVIHAGLECGIFSQKIEGLDCISIGPNNYDIHTPNEHLSISSTARVYKYLLEVLKNIK